MKQKVYQSVLQLLEQKIKIAQQMISSIQDSRNNEAKSSAGDKYETSRAMMQIELEKQGLVLHKLLEQFSKLEKIQKIKPSDIIGLGSWVKTNQGNYLIAVGIGRVEDAFVISLASNLGKIFKGMKSGDSMIFQDKEYHIQHVQ